MNPGVLTKGDAFDSGASAFRAVAKGKDRTTERVLIFEKGPLAGLVRFEFKAMGKNPCSLLRLCILMQYRRLV